MVVLLGAYWVGFLGCVESMDRELVRKRRRSDGKLSKRVRRLPDSDGATLENRCYFSPSLSKSSCISLLIDKECQTEGP